jgi:tetratricopeptide (TPR) repeat protein
MIKGLSALLKKHKPMKRVSFFLAIVLIMPVMLSAQKSTRTSAYNYLKKGELAKAKEYIDKAVAHEKTMNDAKTWFYYGNTYVQIATTEDEAFKNLDPDPLEKAYQGYIKCIELDEKGTYKLKVIQDMTVIGNNYYARGLDAFNAEDFETAFNQFSKSVEVNKSLDMGIDTLAIYAAAMSAASAEKNEEAKTFYNELIDLDYDRASIYSELANIYKDEENLDMAKEALQKGIDKYPNDAGILFAKINISLSEEKYEEVIESLESAIVLAPDNHTLYFVQGQSFEAMGEKDKAEKSYLKAIEVKPDYIDAYYNLGALYFNKGVDLYTKANDLPLDATDEYDKLSQEANKHFLDAQPYFEKVNANMPENEDEVFKTNLKNSLTQIYQRTKQNDKLSELRNN